MTIDEELDRAARDLVHALETGIDEDVARFEIRRLATSATASPRSWGGTEPDFGLICQECGETIRPSTSVGGWTHVKRLRLLDPRWHLAQPVP